MRHSPFTKKVNQENQSTDPIINHDLINQLVTSQVYFQPNFLGKLDKINSSAQKISVLVTNEFEGLTRNGGIGTYYTNLSQKLADDGWTVILLLCQTELEYDVKHKFEQIDQVVSISTIPEILAFQPIHHLILDTAQQNSISRSFGYQSICCLFFMQALVADFPEAVIYAEFPEIWGFGYHTIQAKQAGLVGHRCLTGVTSHGSFEWLREINSQYQIGDGHWFWQAYHYERFSYEQADIIYSPSRFLKAKVAEYGWKTSRVKLLPYFVPSLLSALDSRLNGRSANSLAITPDRVPVIFFGRLEERKGLCDFLAAVQLLDATVAEQIQLVFVGKIIPLNSSSLSHLNSQQYIEQELGDEFVYTLHTELASQEAIAAIANLSNPIVCLTSLQENFPNTALEMGQLPVHLVVSDTGGFHETLALIQRIDGIHWFQPGNPHSLAKALTQAVQTISQTPSVPSPEIQDQTNQNLLNQRLEYMSQAFLSAAPQEPLTPDVTLFLICGHPDDGVIECLASLVAQTYGHLEVIIVTPGRVDEHTTSAIAQAQAQFPDYKYLTTEDGWSLGATYNYLVQQTTGEYILFFPANQVAASAMVERLVTAANEAEAKAVVCPQLVLSDRNQSEQITLIDGNLLNLLEFKHHYDLTALFARSFVNAFPYSEERCVLALNWQLFAAAIATDQPIAYYPYPLYAINADTEIKISVASFPKERYYLRQFLSQIPSEQWHRRQINLLLTGFEQITQHISSPQPLPPPSSPQEQAWQMTAQQLHSELTQVQTHLQMLAPWNQELQADKVWLESQWHTWMLKAQKTDTENSQLRSLVQGMQSSQFWRLRRVWLKLKGKISRFEGDPLLPPPHTYTPGVQEFIARMAGQKVRFFQRESYSTPVISIISSCTQGYEYLETTYRSIINQTLQSFEWLLVKDPTITPAYGALLTSLPQRTPKIRLIDQPNSGNVAAHYNQAIAQAQGQYLCFVDIGAVLDPTYLEKCVLFLASHPQVSVVNSYSIVFQSQEHWWQTHLNRPNSLIQQLGLFCHPVYRKTTVDALGLFDTTLICGADWDYCLKAIAHNAPNQTGWTIPEFLDGYRATPHIAPAIAPRPTVEVQRTLSTIQSRYQTSLSHQLTTTLTPLPLDLNTLNFQFQMPNRRIAENSGKQVLLFCDALDTSELAQWNCDLVLWLANCGYDLTIVTTSTSEHTGEAFFYPATADIFHLPSLFDPAHWFAFLHYLLQARQMDAVLVSGSTLAESFLPVIRSKFPQMALLIYAHLPNQQNEPHGQSSVHFAAQAYDSYLDYYLVTSHRQARSYAASHPNAPIKTKVCQTQPDVEAALTTAIQERKTSKLATMLNGEQAMWELLKNLPTSMIEPMTEPQISSQSATIPIRHSSELTVRQLIKLLLKKIIKG